MEKAVAILCVFGLGMCLTLLGSISVKLMPRLKIDKGKFGSLISTFMFSCLVASLIIGVVIDKIGYKPVAVFGFAATALCILLLAQGKTFVMAAVACILLGFGAMALNTAGNTLIPVVLFEGQNPAAASNLGNVSTCLGLFLSPMLVSLLLKRTSYEKTVSVLGLIVLAPVILAILAIYPQSQAGFAFSDALALLAKPAVLVSALVLFCYIALESSFCNWLPAFGKEVISQEKSDVEAASVDASAQRLLSILAIAMMVGRLGASQIPKITEYGSWVVAASALVTGLIVLAMMAAKTTRTAQVLAALAGLAFAPCFPTTIGVRVFGIIFAIGLLGAVIVPKAIGNLAKGSSIQKSLKLLLPICVALIILALVLGRI
jgi:fucose permease